MELNIQSHVATVYGYIRPSINNNDTKECAVLNSLSFSLERYNKDLYYRGKPVSIFTQSWDRETGILSITLNN